MTAPLKLSELVAARAVMTPGPYARGEWTEPRAADGERDFKAPKVLAASDCRGHIVPASDPTRTVISGCGCCGSPDATDEDAVGLVATHNAADVLIEIAQAALAWRAARDNGGAAMWDDKAASAIMTATEILRDALDKIEP